jgi:heme exporter protein C
MVGLCGLPILYFAILWWSARQATKTLDLHLDPEVATILLPGMLAMAFGLFSYTIAAALTRLRIVILERERNSDWVARRFGEHG